MEEIIIFILLYCIEGKKEAQRIVCFPSCARETEILREVLQLQDHPPRKGKNIQETEALNSTEAEKLPSPHC